MVRSLLSGYDEPSPLVNPTQAPGLGAHLDLISRCQSMLADVRADLAMFFVAHRALMDLAQVSLHGGERGGA